MEQEWRCENCGKLLGIVRDERMHIRFGRGREFLVGFPVTHACPTCHALHELKDAKAITAIGKKAAADR